MFWCSLVVADRRPKEAMPLPGRNIWVLVSFLCWERKVIRAEKIIDGRVPLPARSGYISENRGTVLEKVDTWQSIPRRFSDTAG